MPMGFQFQLMVGTGSAVVTPRDAIATTAWLSSVPDSMIDQLADQSALHRVPSGSTLFEQAETPAFALLLVGGSVELLAVRGAEETLVECVRAPELLLPAAVLNRQPYLMRARVLDEARIVMIQAEAFRQAVASNQALCLAVLACQAAQFRRQIKHAKNLQLRSAEERVGCYLLRLADDAAQGKPVRLPLEKRLIASQLGMTRETFSRILAGLTRHGIKVEGDLVHLEDVAAAQARFHLDPLLDGPEPIIPLQAKKGNGP
jgi:CRP/FNR family transcriptional regulator, transcriptional activator FtrB